jgi:ribosomal protein L37E
MNKEKTIIIRLEEDLHNKYKKLCKENGYNLSQRIRNYILNEIKNK